MVGNEGSTGNVRDLGSHTHTQEYSQERSLSLSLTQILTREVLYTHILYADGATTKHH